MPERPFVGLQTGRQTVRALFPTADTEQAKNRRELLPGLLPEESYGAHIEDRGGERAERSGGIDWSLHELAADKCLIQLRVAAESREADF